jgi:nanoRNase/pAp phosphatase (c-di-AMP/oligoRNAs hydrolase)
MVAAPPTLRDLLSDPSVVRIEFDHHIESDSDYIGDPDYALVTEASSAAELVGYVALKLSNQPGLLLEHHVGELFTRNLVLAILTGIIGDSQMGRFLKSNRERRAYGIFSSLFNDLLVLMTTTQGNLSTKEEVFAELGRLSASEKSCNDLLLSKSVDSGSTSYVALDEDESRTLYEAYDQDTIVSVARSVADTLAERSGRLSLIAYYDCSKPDGLVQFRIRRSQAFKRFDVRRIIEMNAVGNGGGHEGAIGFRFERHEIDDIHDFVRKIIAGVEAELARLPD